MIFFWKNLLKFCENNIKWKIIHAFFYKQQFYKQHQAEIGKKSMIYNVSQYDDG